MTQDVPADSLTVSAEVAGLGNRIKSWASAMRLGNDVRVHCPVNRYMPATFPELFAADCGIGAVPGGATVYASWRLHVMPEDLAHLPAGFATVGAGAHPLIRGLGKAWWNISGRHNDRYEYMLFPKSHSRKHTRADARHIDLEYGRIPNYFREIYVPLFNSISFNSSIQERANSWAERNLDADVIGVQIRTWRDDPRRHRKYHRPARKRLFELMRNAAADKRFLIVSDGDEILQELTRKFGSERILSYTRNTGRDGSWQLAEGVTEDLIDMLLLAKTGHMFASYLSTFSETAWWLGGATARVQVF